MKPRVSVVITAYNHEDYIAESLYSVLNQTYDNFEIIAINDGSSDSTGSIIEDIKNQYPHKIRFINNKKNTRPKIAGNQGIKAAKGEFIAFNDGDDFWEPTKLEKQISIFDKDKSCSLGLVYTYGRNLNLNLERKVNLIWNEDPKKDLIKQLFHGAFFFKISMMVRAQIIQNLGGYNEKYPMCCDYELMLRIAASGAKFDRVPEVLVNHRIHLNNSTSNRKKCMQNTKQMIIDFSKRYADLIQEKNLNVARRIAIADLMIAKYYITHERYSDARNIYNKLLLTQTGLIFCIKSNLFFFIISHIPVFFINFLKKFKFFNNIFISES